MEALGVEIAGEAFAAAFVAIGGKSVNDANDGWIELSQQPG